MGSQPKIAVVLLLASIIAATLIVPPMHVYASTLGGWRCWSWHITKWHRETVRGSASIIASFTDYPACYLGTWCFYRSHYLLWTWSKPDAEVHSVGGGTMAPAVIYGNYPYYAKIRLFARMYRCTSYDNIHVWFTVRMKDRVWRTMYNELRLGEIDKFQLTLSALLMMSGLAGGPVAELVTQIMMLVQLGAWEMVLDSLRYPLYFNEPRLDGPGVITLNLGPGKAWILAAGRMYDYRWGWSYTGVAKKSGICFFGWCWWWVKPRTKFPAMHVGIAITVDPVRSPVVNATVAIIHAVGMVDGKPKVEGIVLMYREPNDVKLVIYTPGFKVYRNVIDVNGTKYVLVTAWKKLDGSTGFAKAVAIVNGSVYRIPPPVMSGFTTLDLFSRDGYVVQRAVSKGVVGKVLVESVTINMKKATISASNGAMLSTVALIGAAVGAILAIALIVVPRVVRQTIAEETRRFVRPRSRSFVEDRESRSGGS